MRKLLFLTIATIFVSNLIFAQTVEEELKKSKERLEEILKLSSPKKSGVASLDEVVESMDNIASRTTKITPLLRGLYLCSIGQTIEGVADETVTIPTIDECRKLKDRIVANAEDVKKVTKDAANVKDEVGKIKNPMKLKKATTSVKYISKSSAIIVEESTFQVKIIADIIKALKPV